MKRSSCDSGKGGIRHFEVIYLKLLAPIEINGLHILRYREAMHRHVLACFVLPPIDHTRILRRVGFHGLKIDECAIHMYSAGSGWIADGVQRNKSNDAAIHGKHRQVNGQQQNDGDDRQNNGDGRL